MLRHIGLLLISIRSDGMRLAIDSFMFKRTFTLLSIILLMQTPSFAKGIRMGGSDTGGGSGFIVNNQLILQDFKNCPGLDDSREKFLLKSEEISTSVAKIDASQIAKLIEENPKFQNEILKKLMITSALRANWYFVDADLSLDNSESVKLAIFKRPLGILINKNLFNQLSSINQKGLLFHETLRMLSIGFGYEIDQQTLETLTCEAYSKDKFISDWNRTQSKDQFFDQGSVSKFEKLRSVATLLSRDFLEEAFFSWAAVEAPTSCLSQNECHYFEEWPTQDDRIVSSFEKWNLFYNNEFATGWSTDDSRLSIVISKQEFKRNFCEKVSLLFKDKYKLINPRSDLNKITNHNLDYIIKRTNLDYFDEIELLQFNRPICIKVN